MSKICLTNGRIFQIKLKFEIRCGYSDKRVGAQLLYTDVYRKKPYQTKWKKRGKEQKITGTTDGMRVCMCDGGLWSSFAQPPRIILHSFFFGFWFLKFVNLAIFERVNVTAAIAVAVAVVLVVAVAATCAQQKGVWSKNIYIKFGLSVVWLSRFFVLWFLGGQSVAHCCVCARANAISSWQ